MLDKIRADIEEHKLLSSDKPVLVGLSGGADSVALLAVLSRHSQFFFTTFPAMRL